MRDAVIRTLRGIRRVADDDGSTIVIFSLLLPVLIGMVALVIDVGLLDLRRAEAQAAVDAAALAAAQDLPDQTVARNRVNQYLNLNLPWYANPQFGASSQVRFPTDQGRKIVEVDLTAAPPALFGRVFGQTLYAASRGGAAEKTSLDIMLVIDKSGSMCADSPGQPCPSTGPWQPFTSVQNASITFLGHFSETYDRIGLVSYASNAFKDVNLVADFSGGSSAVEGGIRGMRPNGTTNIGHAINIARQELIGTRARGYGRKVMVVLTDGLPNRYDENHPNQVWRSCSGNGYCTAARNYTLNMADIARQNGIVIHTIGLGANVDATLLTQVATPSGGQYWPAPSTAQLGAIFTSIAKLASVRLVQ